MHIQSIYYKTLKHITKHEQYRNECINLIASENLMSPATRRALTTDLGNRYAVGEPDNRWFAGSDYADKIERNAITLAKRLFHADYVNVQPISGMVANMVAYYTLIHPGDLVLALPPKHTGHFSHAKKNLFSLFQARVQSLPFDKNEFTIDVEKTVKLIKRKKPKLILLGTSEFLFPVPIKQLRNACNETGTKILYDAAHVAGLIAGQIFQNPLEEGADLLSMSTNKTLAAPSHGLVACKNNKTYEKRIRRAVIPMFTSNNHLHHIAGLSITLAEFAIFGHSYAMQVVKNAQALAKALYEKEITVLCPQKNFTQSHTVLIDSKISAEKVMQILEKINVITSPFQLPWNSISHLTGLRIGTNEITRLGMTEKEMDSIAKFISDAMHAKKSLKDIRRDVIDFRKQFSKVSYCFN